MTQTDSPRTAAWSDIAPRVPVVLTINEERHTLVVEPRRTLLDVLRHDLAMTGTKKVCDVGNCGACTVIVDDKAMYACLLLAVDCEDRHIRTVEGLGTPAMLDPVQQAFIDDDAFQCGFCTSGQIMSLRALFDQHPTPDDDQISRAVAGNLCRCGAYANIHRAAQRVARQNAGGDEA